MVIATTWLWSHSSLVFVKESAWTSHPKDFHKGVSLTTFCLLNMQFIEKKPTQIHLALVSWVTKVVCIDTHDQVGLSHTVSTEDPCTSCMLFFLSLVTIAWDWQLVPSFNLWIHMQILSEQVLCFNTCWMAHFSIQGHQAMKKNIFIFLSFFP